MSKTDADRVDELVTELRAYLTAHPQAADSARGIAQFWLRRVETEQLLDTLGEALARLQADGWLKRRHNPDGSVIYTSAVRAGVAPSVLKQGT